MRWIIHQIYVDETQDFTQAELCLLLRVCQSPNQMFLTGDTAQSIMRGIAFRFNDLRSLFFYAKKSMHAIGKTSGVKVPKQARMIIMFFVFCSFKKIYIYNFYGIIKFHGKEYFNFGNKDDVEKSK
jgi:hypothetical protein